MITFKDMAERLCRDENELAALAFQFNADKRAWDCFRNAVVKGVVEQDELGVKGASLEEFEDEEDDDTPLTDEE